MRDLSAYTVTKVGRIRKQLLADLWILSAHELRPARRQWNYHLPRRFWA